MANKDLQERRKKRKELIRKISSLRKSAVIAYVCSDRENSPFAHARIAPDIIRPIYDHILALQSESKESGTLDLFIYSRGGDVSVPWTLVSMIREHYKTFNVLIPFRAHSAATMIAVGADNIIMGPKGELSPFDPTLSRLSQQIGAPPQHISVEDVSSYVDFIRERAGITDQAALAQCTNTLARQLQPLTLGSVNRMYSHIRLVAKKLLAARAKKIDEERGRVITEVLTEKIYSHGHSISRQEAIELGLQVVKKPARQLEKLMWDLYLEYEQLLELREPIDPIATLDKYGKEEHTLEDVPIACIESVKGLHAFQQDIVITRQRKVPTNPTINISLNLQVPPIQTGQPTQPPQIPQEVINQLMQQIGKTVREQIVQQSETVGVQVRTAKSRWREVESIRDKEGG
jgi:hypothetical protein